MKKIGLTTAFAAIAVSSLFAQSEVDALKYSKIDLNGTARYMSMGGAFGALGGDISSLSNNPAGIGVYRSSEFAATANINNVATSCMWNGQGVDASNMKFNFNNIAYIGTFKPDVEGLVNLNFGFGFNRLKDYYRNYLADNKSLNAEFTKKSDKNAIEKKGISLTDYIAAKSYGVITGTKDLPLGTNDYTAYDYYDWMTVLAFKGYMIDADKANPGIFNPLGSTTPSAILNVSERGFLDEYDISVGGNIYDVFYFGATVGITDLNYRTSITYDERFSNMGGFTLNNNYHETRGSGVNLRLGAILRPLDFLRLGLSVNLPLYAKMTDYFDANVENNYNDGTADHDGTLVKAYVPEGAFRDYSMKSPFNLQTSAAFVLGKKGIISCEYEMTDYSGMKMKDTKGYALGVNDFISTDFVVANTIKVGGEYRVTKQMSLRGGFATQSSPYDSKILNQDLEVLVLTGISSRPDYALDRGTNYYTGGLGYRFGSSYLNFAFVHRVQKEDVYAFSPFEDSGYWIVPEKATLKTTANQVLVTFGVKF